MQRVFEKIIERLEGLTLDKEDLKEIVSEKLEELEECMNGGGWIPVSSGEMPKEHDSIFPSIKEQINGMMRCLKKYLMK